MCHQLAEFRKATVGFADAFDPALLSLADARACVAGANAIENAWATLKALAAARVADAGDQGAAGQRQASEELARTTGTSLGGARNIIDVGRKLRRQPKVAAAALRGELSAAQTSAITGAAAVDPAAEDRLVDSAADTSLPELRDECARTKAAAEPDPDKRHADIRSGRRLRTWTDAGGVGQLHANGNVEDIAQVMAAIGPLADQLFDQTRGQGRREPSEAYAFDGLVELALRATSAAVGGPDTGSPPPSDGAETDADLEVESTGGRRKRRGAPVKLHLRVDLDTWLRGCPIEGEMCELVGYGPVPVSVVRNLVAQGDPFVTAILTKAKAVVGVAHLGRKPTAYQRSAIEWLYPSCAVRGCPARAHLQVDHRTDWAKTHFTLLDWLDRLCIAHHNRKTRDGWALVHGIGKRSFVAPSDPRHPRHSENDEPTRPLPIPQ